MCSLALVGMSLVGLWKGVDYSGWVLAVGLLVALNT
jgi:hypothetical protein